MLAGRSQLVQGLECHLAVHTSFGRKGGFMRARGKVCHPSRLPAACICLCHVAMHAMPWAPPSSCTTLHNPPL